VVKIRIRGTKYSVEREEPVVIREDKNEYVKIRTYDIVVVPGSHGSGGSKKIGFMLWTLELHRARD
jgi:hypothetical protein